MELLTYEMAHERLQLRQDIKEYKRLITLIDIEIYRWAIEIMDGIRARAEVALVLSEAERKYADYLRNK